MGEKAQLIPLSEGKRSHMSTINPTDRSTDALNRFRITHSDRELRPLLRRLHRLPMLATQNEASPGEAAIEVEMAKLELLKWKVGVERIMGSVANLQRQKEVYERRAAETGQLSPQKICAIKLTSNIQCERLRSSKRRWKTRNCCLSDGKESGIIRSSVTRLHPAFWLGASQEQSSTSESVFFNQISLRLTIQTVKYESWKDQSPSIERLTTSTSRLSKLGSTSSRKSPNCSMKSEIQSFQSTLNPHCQWTRPLLRPLIRWMSMSLPPPLLPHRLSMWAAHPTSD